MTGTVAHEGVVGPADQGEHQPPAEREADDEEQRRCRARSGHADARSTLPCCARPKMMAMMTQPIVSSMIAEATMICPRLRRMKLISRTTIATILTEEIDSAVPRNSEVIRRWSGSRQQRLRQELAEREAAGERDGDAGERDADRRAARPCAPARQVGLHAGEQQQHQDAELRDRRRSCSSARACAGKIACCSLRPERAEHRRSEQEAGEQLPMTAGWPMRCMTSPNRRPTSSRTMI